jgi:hypothetical protein
MIGRRSMCLVLAAALSAACSHPTVPEWEERAHEGFEQYQRSYFAGDRTADRDFRKAADALATTGKPELRARGELIGCALATAALDFERCNAWQSLQADADQADRAYGALLSGRISGLDAKALPAQYGALAKATDAAARNDALKRIEDPLSRLIGAGAVFRAGDLSPEGVALAVDTASEQGWRRPLLAWLGAQAGLAEAAGDAAALARIRKRIDVVAPPAR